MKNIAQEDKPWLPVLLSQFAAQWYKHLRNATFLLQSELKRSVLQGSHAFHARRSHANSALSSSHESAYRQHLSISLKPVLLHLAAPGPMVGRPHVAREGSKELEGCKARQVPPCWMLGFGKELLREAALLLKQQSI